MSLSFSLSPPRQAKPSQVNAATSTSKAKKKTFPKVKKTKKSHVSHAPL
jgi:hypothetical protein